MLHVAPFGEVPSFRAMTKLAQARFFLGSLALLQAYGETPSPRRPGTFGINDSLLSLDWVLA